MCRPATGRRPAGQTRGWNHPDQPGIRRLQDRCWASVVRREPLARGAGDAPGRGVQPGLMQSPGAGVGGRSPNGREAKGLPWKLAGERLEGPRAAAAAPGASTKGAPGAPGNRAEGASCPETPVSFQAAPPCPAASPTQAGGGEEEAESQPPPRPSPPASPPGPWSSQNLYPAPGFL